MVEDKQFWPTEKFTNLQQGATFVSPAMGCGHFPEGFGKSAYVSQIKVVITDSAVYKDPYDYALGMYVDKPDCHNARHNWGQAGWGCHFGGPGNCTFQ